MEVIQEIVASYFKIRIEDLHAKSARARLPTRGRSPCISAVN